MTKEEYNSFADDPEGMEQETVHIDQLRTGDTVLCKDGRTRTVTSSYLRRDEFMGTSVFGDCYLWNNRMVKRFKPKKP